MKTGLRRPETAVIAVWESVTTVLLRQSAGEKKTGLGCVTDRRIEVQISRQRWHARERGRRENHRGSAA